MLHRPVRTFAVLLLALTIGLGGACSGSKHNDSQAATESTESTEATLESTTLPPIEETTTAPAPTTPESTVAPPSESSPPSSAGANGQVPCPTKADISVLSDAAKQGSLDMSQVGPAYATLMHFLPPEKGPDLQAILDAFVRMKADPTDPSSIMVLNSPDVVKAFESVMGYWSQNCPGALA